MKHLLIATVLLASPASSQNLSPQDACTVFGELAASVMTARQNGVPLSRVLGVMEQEGDTNDLLREIIMGAYEKMRFATPSNQQRAVDDYRNEVETTCFRAMGG